MLHATGETHTTALPAAALAYLADPRHAGEWFASVDIVRLDGGPPRMGQEWRFVERSARGAARPIRMARYEPGVRFIWETRLGPLRTNIVWEVTASAAPEGGTTLRLVTRWHPGPLGWPAALAAALLARRALARRAQSTIERAREAVESDLPAHNGARSRPARKRQTGNQPR
jgi:hypothetical protein